MSRTDVSVLTPREARPESSGGAAGPRISPALRRFLKAQLDYVLLQAEPQSAGAVKLAESVDGLMRFNARGVAY